MDIFANIFWLLLVLAFIVPMIRQRALQGARLRLVKQMEEERGTKVIALIHRQERMALFGIPLYRYIDIEDSERVLRAIRKTPDNKPIDLILHTPGGLVLASEQIAFAVRSHKATVSVIVPHYAMSGGTLIALAADNIVMDPNAVLGPVDPQVSGQPAISILTAVERKPIAEIDDRTLICADVAQKAMRQICVVLRNIMAGKMDDQKAAEIAHLLCEGRWTHDYPITVDEARGLGIQVSTDVPDQVYDLMELHPQHGRRRPSSENVPFSSDSESDTITWLSNTNDSRTND